MNAEKALALLMWVGEVFYKWPHDFFVEALTRGVSKRVPRTSIPTMQLPVRIYLIHPRACIYIVRKHLAPTAVIDGTPCTRLFPAPDEEGAAESDRQAVALSLISHAEVTMKGIVHLPGSSFSVPVTSAYDSLTRSEDMMRRFLAGLGSRCRPVMEGLKMLLGPGIFMYGYANVVGQVNHSETTEVPPELAALGIVRVVPVPADDARARAREELAHV